MRRILVILTILLLFSAIFTGGCKKATPTTTSLSATEIFSRAGEALQDINSFHFELEQIGGGTPVVTGIEMTEARGDIVRPDKLQTTISGKAMGMFLEIKLVMSGGETYMTNPLNGQWEVLPDEFQILGMFDPAAGVAAIMKDISAPVLLGEEEVDGTRCFHLKGNIISDSLRPIIGSAATGVSISAEVWIGQDDYLARHIEIEGKITESEKEGITRTLDLSNFNQEISIELPE